MRAPRLTGFLSRAVGSRVGQSPDSLTSGDPDRGAFVAYFLGAVVPLGALGFMIGRYTSLSAGPMGGDLGFAPLGTMQLLGLFAGISSLSLACFILLRQLTYPPIYLCYTSAATVDFRHVLCDPGIGS